MRVSSSFHTTSGSGPSVGAGAPPVSDNPFSKSASAARRDNPPIPVQCEFGGAVFEGYVFNKPGQSVNFGPVRSISGLSTTIDHPTLKTRSCSVFMVKTSDAKTLELQVQSGTTERRLAVVNMQSGQRASYVLPESADLSLSVGGSLRFSPELAQSSIVSVWALENRSSQSFYNAAKPGNTFLLKGTRLDAQSPSNASTQSSKPVLKSAHAERNGPSSIPARREPSPAPSASKDSSVAVRDAIRYGRPIPFPITPAEAALVSKIQEARRGLSPQVPLKISLAEQEARLYRRLMERGRIQEELAHLSHTKLCEWLKTNQPPTGRSDYDFLTTHPDLRSMTSNELCELLPPTKTARRAALKSLEELHSSWQCPGTNARGGAGSGWLHWKINDTSTSGETHKLYVTTKSQLQDVNPTTLEALIRHLAAKGFSGQVKVDATGTGMLRYDQIVIHARNPESLLLAEKFMQAQSYVRGLSRGVDRFGLSYNQFHAMMTTLAREGTMQVPFLNFDWEQTRKNIHIEFPAQDNPRIVGILNPETGTWIGKPGTEAVHTVAVTLHGITRHFQVATFSRQQAARIGEERIRKDLNNWL